MKKIESFFNMITFIHTKGKKEGKPNWAELSLFLGKDESTLRSLYKRNKEEFEIVHLGAICKANGITLEKLTELKNSNCAVAT